MRLVKWEFLPFWLFYIPVYFYWFWLSLRARSLVFFSAANPGMEMGGFCAYSKYNILKKINARLIPKTLFINAHIQSPQEIISFIRQSHIEFPLIIKPDMGERGRGVEKIPDKHTLLNYLAANPYKLLIQEYVDYPLELGIMYHRLPGQTKGHITSVVQKEFLAVRGDGKSTLLELCKKSKRARYHLAMLAKLYENDLQKVLPEDEVMELVSIGNHCRGTTFLNANHLITPALQDVFDKISYQIDGFYFGRYDVRVPDLDDLYAGKNIKILELNGANSEPAHIYDPDMSIIKAYRHLFRHWRNLFDVSIRNHQQGTAFMPFWEAALKIRNRFNPSA